MHGITLTGCWMQESTAYSLLHVSTDVASSSPSIKTVSFYPAIPQDLGYLGVLCNIYIILCHCSIGIIDFSPSSILHSIIIGVSEQYNVAHLEGLLCR